MKWFYVEPEVAGGLGVKTILERTVHPPIITKLHYEFDGWLGDELLTSFPCFIITENGKLKLQAAQLTGARFDRVEVTTSEQFQELYPGRELPRFVWLRVEGKPSVDDLGISPDGRLIVSEKTLETLRELSLTWAIVTEFES